MKAEKLILDLINPLVTSGIYKDKVVALKDIIADYIERKKGKYDEMIFALQNKHHRDFESFTGDIKNKATIELEEDWMEWKSAVEMKKAYEEALKGIINNATEI